ncbi:MAG: hypothetical protein ACW98Y_15390 [Candidatus Thorarchaeota archaeon]|jgi:hypothetical protein
MKKRITRVLAMSIVFCFAVSFLSVGVVLLAQGEAVPPEDIPPINEPVKIEDFDDVTDPLVDVWIYPFEHKVDTLQ